MNIIPFSFEYFVFMSIVLAWSHQDERYCRNYNNYPELTRTIVSRLDLIEDQRAVLHDLSGTDYEVWYPFYFRFSFLS